MAGHASFPSEGKQPIVDQHDATDQVTTHTIGVCIFKLHCKRYDRVHVVVRWLRQATTLNFFN